MLIIIAVPNTLFRSNRRWPCVRLSSTQKSMQHHKRTNSANRICNVKLYLTILAWILKRLACQDSLRLLFILFCFFFCSLFLFVIQYSHETRCNALLYTHWDIRVSAGISTASTTAAHQKPARVYMPDNSRVSFILTVI